MATRRPVAAGNWKLNTTVAEGVALCAALRDELSGLDGVDVVVFPPFTHLQAVGAALTGSHIGLGAQDLFWESKGAYTGEVSAGMVRELAGYAIVGHSERRQYFGDTDDTVNKKLIAALAAGLRPIVCVGESLAERDRDEVELVLTRQVSIGLDRVDPTAEVILAYEPIWAIGTGRAANGELANATMGLIREVIGRRLGRAAAERTRLLYGGSVTADNIAEFMREPQIDGALVGGASLNAEAFAAIARQTAAARAG